MTDAIRDQNHVPVALGRSSSDANVTIPFQVDPSTGRLKVDFSSGGGTVTEISQGVGIKLTPDPITDTGEVALADDIAPIATLGTANQQIRVNAGATALEYFTPAAGGNISGTISDTQVAYGDGADSIKGEAAFTYDEDTNILSVENITLTQLRETSGLFEFYNIGGNLSGFLNFGNITSMDKTYAFPDASGTIALTSDITDNITIGTTTVTSGTNTRILYNNNGVVGEYTISGSGNVAMTTSPSFTTPSLGVATATSINGLTITTSTGTLTIANGSSLVTSGANSITLTSTGATNVTLPTTGTLATLAGTETFTNKTLTAPNIGGAMQLLENASLRLDAALSADGTYSGITITGTAGATLAFGDLIYLDPTDSRWELTDANSASGADGDARGSLGICVLAAASDGDPTVILLYGNVRADAAFPSMTINAPMYVSETAGDITGTMPTTNGNVVRVVGFAKTADELVFKPDNTWAIYAT